eukprot:Polyplicarium_translucidae@DN2282_c0_g1_i5.p1
MTFFRFCPKHTNTRMGCVVAVPNDEVAIIEKCGAFTRVAKPGCVCLPVPGVWTMSGSLTTRIQQIFVSVETKTRDSVFVRLTVAVQFRVLADPHAQYNAFYKLSSPAHQITSYVEDVVRQAVPQIEVDNVFLEKDHIAEAVKKQVKQEMVSFGYEILACLVTNVEPDNNVKNSMNEINASRRIRMAQTEIAEGRKFVQIKNAEAQAEATYLQGEGIARQRKALVDGLRGSVSSFEAQRMTHKDVMDLLLITQYLDTVKEVGCSSRAEITFSPRRRAKEKDKPPNSKASSAESGDASRW